MATWIVTRHPGALHWLQQYDFWPDVCHVRHIDPTSIKSGDNVIGTLPVDLIAQICAQGARYWHLVVPLREDLRGRELSAEDLEALGTRLERYHAETCGPPLTVTGNREGRSVPE